MSSPAVEPSELVQLLQALDVPAEEIEQAVADGALVLLAIDRLALGQELRYDVAAAAALTQLPEEELRHIWRSLGFPEPGAGEQVFSDVDVANFTAVAELLHSGAVTPEVTYGMTRVVGSSMARVASALVDAVSAGADDVLDLDDGGGDRGAPSGLDALASEAGGFLPMFPAVLEQVWRRHLQDAARRRLLRHAAEDGTGLVVGCAALGGFTARAGEGSEGGLADIGARFEGLAYDVVVAGGGGVVKVLGEGVLFLGDDPLMAAEIALGLADASRDAAKLGDVRVGLALGPVLEREGDAYGATVNLASRITSIAYPGTVVVSPELREALSEHGQLAFRVMRPRVLKHIGRVALAVMRRPDDMPSTMREVIDERRQVLRDAVRDRLALLGGAGDPQPEPD